MASGGLGANLNVPSSFDIKTFLFNEAPGQIVVSVNPNNVATFRKILGPENILDLGVVTTEKALKLNNHFSLENSELELAWRHLC